MHIVWDSTWTRNSYSWLEAHPPRARGHSPHRDTTGDYPRSVRGSLRIGRLCMDQIMRQRHYII
jgi:hypothetical protein